jgi:hypothetical protein
MTPVVFSKLEPTKLFQRGHARARAMQVIYYTDEYMMQHLLEFD